MRKLVCPDLSITREERIERIAAQLNDWIHAAEMDALVDTFSGDAVIDWSDGLEYLHILKRFASIWDYRQKQKDAQILGGEGARWLIRDDEQVEAHKDLVFLAAQELGLHGHDRTDLTADYILPLGGSITSNLLRCKQAKTVCDRNGAPAKIVALSTMRLISDTERKGNEYTAYGEDSVYEYDSMCRAVETVFGVKESEEIRSKGSLGNASWAVRSYSDQYEGCSVSVIAAPSSDPDNRRANSADCFEWFFEHGNVPKASAIVNATGDIYCPYQQTRALDYAIRHEVVMDTCGYLSQKTAVEYLQEIKSTIDAMYDFSVRYGLI